MNFIDIIIMLVKVELVLDELVKKFECFKSVYKFCCDDVEMKKKFMGKNCLVWFIVEDGCYVVDKVKVKFVKDVWLWVD